MAMAMATTTVSWSSSSLSFSSSFSLFSSNCNGNNKLKLLKSSKSKSNPIRASQTSSDLLPPLPVLSVSGEKLGEAHLRLKSAPPDTARAVVHRGIITDLQNRRRGTASTLTRAEVRGGGKKPFPQKKLGRARRGSQRTPLRPGGGVIFGPKPKDWSIKINRKEKRLAISTAIASAVKSMDALVIDDEQQTFSSTSPPKTKDFIATMKIWGLDPAQKTTFLMMEVPENVRLSGRNIPTVKMLTPRTLNLFDVLNANKLVFTRGALDYLNSIYGAQEDEFEDEQVLEEQPKQEEEQPAGNEGVAVEGSTSTD